MLKKYNEEIQTLLKQVYDTCQNEDTTVRERQIRQWRQLKLLWEGFHRAYFSEVAHDWRIDDGATNENDDQDYYDKPINIFRAYLESIIAALSVLVPPIKCYPDDADNSLDLATAKAGDKICQLIYRHNDVPLLWLHALFIFVTEGMTAFYSRSVEDYAFGTYQEKETDEIEEEHEIHACPNCGNIIDDKVVEPSLINEAPIIPSMSPMQQAPIVPPPMMEPMPMNDMGNPMEMMGQPPVMGLGQPPLPNPNEGGIIPNTNDILDEFNPSGLDAELNSSLLYGEPDLCPACMVMMNPEIKREKFIVTRLVKETSQPKARQCLDAYGGLYVKVGNYARKQKDCPYLIFSEERDYSLVVEQYDHLHGNLGKYEKEEFIRKLKSDANGYSEYDQWGRLSPQYQGEYPTNVITINIAWIRPARFNVLSDKEDIDKLRKEFPNGVRVVFADDTFAEACNESLDDHWTLTENPMSDYLHFEPLGQSAVSTQEITNDLISLILQTIEHGIGQTFADPAVLNFKAYSETETKPGGVFPATPKSGKTMGEAFHELRTATLSSEVMPFASQIQSLGQVSLGALPSIFGGQIEGSETASEYSMSRSQALQRLQNNWKLFTATWKTLFGKVIPQYIKNVQDDERDVQKDGDGNFVNILIRKSELEGKIGKVELEANENLPMTWTQRKDLIMNLMESQNPKVMEILNAPENLSILHEALGLSDFYIPGEDDIIKTYDDIKILLDSQPIPTGDPMMPEVSSIPIDPDYDNPAISFEIIRKWIISETGRNAKIENEAGYKNVLLFGKAYLNLMQQKQMEQMQQQMMAEQGGGAAPLKKPNPKKQEAPIQGESNVQTQS